ncbi:MAG: DUF4340 domain-containing protein [Deltaproteobacteria bacterium]|nr:DUF4340 domain-containing protein [Deltaproteobacteria bacterium]
MKSIRLLGIILAIQVILIVFMHLGGDELATYVANQPLMAFNDKIVDRIVIEEKEKSPLIIAKGENGWLLPENHDFPIEKTKLDGILNSINQIKRPYAVGNTELAAKKLRVASDDFEKKVVFYQKEQPVGSLFMGTSPVYKKVHVRVNEEAEIFEVPFDSYALNADKSNWQDNAYLHLDKESIAKLSLNGFVLERKEGAAFAVSKLSENESTRSDKANELLEKVSNISFSDVIGKEPKPEHKDYQEVLSYTVGLKSEKTREYKFRAKDKEATDYVLKISDDPYYFEVKKYVVEDLEKAKREDLIEVKAALQQTEIQEQAITTTQTEKKAEEEAATTAEIVESKVTEN